MRNVRNICTEVFVRRASFDWNSESICANNCSRQLFHFIRKHLKEFKWNYSARQIYERFSKRVRNKHHVPILCFALYQYIYIRNRDKWICEWNISNQFINWWFARYIIIFHLISNTMNWFRIFPDFSKKECWRY